MNARNKVLALARMSALQPGKSVTGFAFDSTQTPAQLASTFTGTGIGHGDPVTTAFLYIAAPFGDPGAQIVTKGSSASHGAPEPAAPGLLGLGPCGTLLRRQLI
jgi:hypothetical protein